VRLRRGAPQRLALERGCYRSAAKRHRGEAVAGTARSRKPLPWLVMTDDAQNLVLEHLKAIRAEVLDIRRDLRDLKPRLASMENQAAQLHKGIAFLHEDLAGVNARLDRLDARIERIERRLELREAV
jgi:septal ring factor EnvC (AmiA/AmiB activator)